MLTSFSLKAEESDVNVKEIVLEHLSDSHEWHITTIGGHDVIVPLPVIVKTSEGWKTFSSSRLHHHATYEGLSIDENGLIVETLSDGSKSAVLDLSLTKTAAGLLINSFVVVMIILCAARWYRHHSSRDHAPSGFTGLVEWLVNAILEGVIIPCVGPKWEKFAPYLLTAFFFIFVNNLMGLIPIFPGGANVTGNIAVTMILAVCTMLMVNVFGNKHYWKDILWPEVPVWLKLPVPLMPIIEIIGIFTKPFALMIRLFANILAGHTVILILTCIIFVTVKMGAAVNTSMSAIAVALGIFMNCLELLVAFLQAYVFTMLSSIFIGLANTEEEEEEIHAPRRHKFLRHLNRINIISKINNKK